jgi:hypothetical protein
MTTTERTPRMPDATRTLLDALRPSLVDIADWVGAERPLLDAWHQGRSKPNPKHRARLVRATRRHAKHLLALAEVVEREGGVE